MESRTRPRAVVPLPKGGDDRPDGRDDRRETPKDLKSSVQSLAKGFRVLEAFSAAEEEMTLSEVADVADLDAGTTFRMLNTLVDLGYVTRVPDSRRFRLTLKVLDLGFNAVARQDLRTLVRPVLRSLVGELGEAASFGVLDGGDIIYLERMRAGLTRLGVEIRIGTPIPAAMSVIGRAILAFLPKDALERALATPPRQGILAAPTPSRVELLPALEAIRERGYLMQESMIAGGLRILAAPVLDRDGVPVGVISIVTLMSCSSDKEMSARAVDPMLAAARSIARALEASGSTGLSHG
jgi:IclR family pca regulon transcriptional regulator